MDKTINSSTSDTDLWNLPIGEFKSKYKRKATQPRGHAGPIGSGPKGETCKTCKYLTRITYAKTYLKCGLMRQQWTGGPGTDIRAKDAACWKWEAESTELPTHENPNR